VIVEGKRSGLIRGGNAHASAEFDAVPGAELSCKREQHQRPRLRHAPGPAKLADCPLDHAAFERRASVDLTVGRADSVVDHGDRRLRPLESIAQRLDAIDDAALVGGEPPADDGR
jgi:hypothetical protein